MSAGELLDTSLRRITRFLNCFPALMQEDVAEIQQLYEMGFRKMEKLKQRISELENQLDECLRAVSDV